MHSILRVLGSGSRGFNLLSISKDFGACITLRFINSRPPNRDKATMYAPSSNCIDNDLLPARYVDLRSDTFTVPTPEMRKAMFEAEVGDDVVGEDPTINALQEKIAQILGKEAAIFVPSGTMSNLTAVLAHCHNRGDSVLIGDKSHIYTEEDGGCAELGGVMVYTARNNSDGTFDIEDIEKRNYSLVCIENTFNGCVLPIEYVDKLAAKLQQKGIPLHVDGARLFNAAVYHKLPAARLVQNCSSVSVCLSKGLGAPVGSLLVGSKSFIERAHRIRHRLGGAMRQVGVLGAPGRVALEKGVDRLAEDHRRMYEIASTIDKLKSPVLRLSNDLSLVHTNMAFLNINPRCCTAAEFLKRIGQVTKEEKDSLNGLSIGIKCYDFGTEQVRFVTYSTITDQDVQDVCQKMKFVVRELEKKLND